MTENATIPEQQPVPEQPAPAAPEVPTYAPPTHRDWRHDRGSVIALTIAGALAFGVFAFGAGWTAHGVASWFGAAHGFARIEQGYGGPTMQGGYRGGPMMDQRGFDERGMMGRVPEGAPGQQAPGVAPDQVPPGCWQN